MESRHALAEAAKARLKSGVYKQKKEEQAVSLDNLTSRGALKGAVDADKKAAGAAQKKAMTDYLGKVDTTNLSLPGKTAMPAFDANLHTPLTNPTTTRLPVSNPGAIPNLQPPNPFTPKPVDSSLLPTNNTVRASVGPKAPSTGNNTLDKLLLSGIGAPIAAGYDQLVHGMQTAVNFQQQPTSQVPSTGVNGLDKFLRGTGEFLPGLGSGAPTGGGLASETSGAVQRVGSNLTPKVVSSLAKVSPEAAYGVQQAAPVATRIASHAIGAGTENAVIGAAAGQTDTNQVAGNFTAGAALGGAGSALKEATMPLLTKAARALVDKYKPVTPEAPEAPKPLGETPLPKAAPEAPKAEPLKPKQELPKTKVEPPETKAEPTPKHNDAIAKLDKEAADYKAHMEQSVKDGIRTSEEAAKQLKGHAMRNAAEKRRIIQGDSLISVKGGLTDKELADKIAKMKSNHVGKEVIVDGKKGTITKMSFGKVGVKFADGTETFHAPESVKPAVDVDAVIKKQQAPKPDPLKPKTELPKKPKAEPKRANFKTMAEAEGLSPELKKEIAKNDDRYTPITNKETVAEADKTIMKKGVKDAALDFLSRQSTEAQHIAEGYRLMQILDAQGNHEQAAKVAAHVAESLTKAGQQAQAGRIIKRLSPEGQMLALARKAEESGKPVTPEDSKAFSAAAKQYAATAGSEQRTNAMQDVLDKLEAGKAPTKEDIRILESNIKRAKKFIPEKAKVEKAAKPKTKRDKVLEKLQSAEDEAWKRIKARRNIGFTPGKGNETVDWSIIAANRVAKGTIKASNHVEQIVKLFGEDVRPIATKIYNKSLKYLARHPELKVIKNNISTAEQLVEQWAKKTATTGADLKKVRDLAESLGKLEGKKGKQADEQMQMIMAKYEKSSVFDKAQALRFMAMLGNTGTQLLNASSNIAMASLKNTVDVFGAMIDSSISSILKKPRTTTAMGMAPWKFTWGMLKNMREGGRANWKGVNPGGLHSVSEIHGLAFSKKWGPLNWAERSLRTVAGGADYGIYKTQFDNEILKQARLAAKKVPKAERAKFIRDFKANPPSEALEIADNVGKETTFQQANSLGDLAAGIPNRLGNIKGKGRIPGKMLEQGIRAVVPFIRTPFNILETGVSLTPGGLLRGTIELIMAKTPSAQRQAISHLSLGITGSGLTAAGYYLHHIGIITDANDSGNKNLDEVRAEAGRGAYRFNQSGMLRFLHAMFSGGDLKAAAAYKEGDRTFNYNKLQPIAFPVALGAGFEKGGVSGGLTQGVGSLLAMSSLKSIQDVVSTGYSGSEGEKQLGVVNRVVESYLKSFSPSLLAQEARREDTTQRQTTFNKGLGKDLGDYYKSRVPSVGGLVPNKLTSKSLPVKVTPLGQTKLGPSGIAENYANPYQSDVQQFSKAAAIIADLIDRTGSDSIAPSAPPKKIKGVAIPPKRYEQYQRDIGQEITQGILAIPSNMPDTEKVELISHIMSDTKKKYATLLKIELGVH